MWAVPVTLVGGAAVAFGWLMHARQFHRHDFVLEGDEDNIKCGCGVYIPFSRV